MTSIEGQEATEEAPPPPALLTEPFLQLPGSDSVHVVWFTEFVGQGHTVTYGAELDQTIEAETTELSRVAEDQLSFVGEQKTINEAGEEIQIYTQVTPRDIWRHEAVVTGLSQRVPYFVTSIADDGTEVVSGEYTLAPLPTPGQSLRILLTSDHQMKPMTLANLQKVGQVDAVFFAGDLINIPDRASEWFDDNRGYAFFPAMQGRGSHRLERTLERDDITYNTATPYQGAAIIQNAPLFPVIGNHEVMGRYNRGNDLDAQFNDPHPRAVAEALHEQNALIFNPNSDPAIRDQWITDNSFNTITYEEIFTLPDSGPDGEKYWSMTFGDVYVIGLFAARVSRTPTIGQNDRGRYREAENTFNTPENWGWGEFPFWDVGVGSVQYEWLQQQMRSAAFRNARYRVVLMHHAIHGLGDNTIPAYTNPVQTIEYGEDGRIAFVKYEYPKDQNILVNDVLPLLEQAGVHLVQMAHSHIWNRFRTDSGVNLLETSNVGSTYGCYVEGFATREASQPADPERYDVENYAAVGDPYGLTPVFPSIVSPMTDTEGNPLPCIASEDLTVFSILDTGSGVVSSYYFDTRDPTSEVVLFDEFSLTAES